MTDRYAAYTGLKFVRSEPRILEIVFDTPGRTNSLDATKHRELAEVWRDVDGDPDVSCVLLRGEGGGRRCGGGGGHGAGSWGSQDSRYWGRVLVIGVRLSCN